MFKKHILIIFQFLLLNVINAQQFIAAKFLIKDNNLYLRWVPSDYKTLQEIIKDTIVVERIKWQNSTLPTDKYFISSERVAVSNPYSKNAPVWKILFKERKEFGLMYHVLFSQNLKGDANIPFGLAMLQCDLDSSLAKAAGLYAKISVSGSETYCYQIRLKNKKTINPAKFLVNHASNSSLATIDSLKVKTSKHEIQLIWKDSLLINDYSSYNIERSENNSSFVRINASPVIKITTKDEKRKNYLVFNDTAFRYNTHYRYRILGRTFFGIDGPYSNTVSAFVPKPIEIIPSLDSALTANDTTCKIVWHFTGKESFSEINRVKLFRSSNEQSNYNIIACIAGTTLSFIDTQPLKTNYYKLAAYNIYGDSIVSNSIMFCRPDVKPPHIPQNFQGDIDTSGNVRLYWKANSDNDLLGYRVFRCNASNEDKIEVTTNILTDTIFKDKIDLNTLSTHVYYAITAVDSVYNNSEFSSTLTLKRPDKIPPVPAQINSVLSEDIGVRISILKSSSRDTKQYILFSITDSLKKKIAAWHQTDTLSVFTDTSFYQNSWVHYKLITEDSTGNKSSSISKSIFVNKTPQNPIEFNFKVSFERKSILLSWPTLKNVYSYTIYKAKNNESFIAYKTFKNNCRQFEDYSLNIGNEYRYKLKILFEDGNEVYSDKTLIVDF